MPNIGNHEAKIGPPVLITLVLLTIIPSSPGYIDCRISCRRCHENTEHPAVLEVYCAMCEECKQRRRERMQGRALQGKANPTSKPSAQPTLKPLAKLTKLKQLVRMRDGEEANANDEAMQAIIKPQDNVQFRHGEQDYPGQPQQQQPFVVQQLLNPPQRPPQRMQPQLSYKPQKALRGMEYPAGCPTPPICSDSEDEEERLHLTDVPPFVHSDATTATVTITTTTTTTTTTQQPCPPITQCRKKKKKTTGKSPCTNPCMFPPYMCPCPIYPPTHPYWPPSDPTNFPPMPPNFRPSDVPPMPVPYPPHPYPPNPYPPPMYPPPPPVLVPMPPPPWSGWFPPMYPPTHSSIVSTLEFGRETTKTTISIIPSTITTIPTTETNEGYFYLHVGLPVQNNT